MYKIDFLEELLLLSLLLYDSSIIFEDFVSVLFINIPPKTPVINATTGLIIAKGNPSSEYVTITESIPVCGVEIKNETVDPFDAPFLNNDIPVGITPHEQSGRGMPNSVAFTTDLLFFLPRYLEIYF
jgi:hypothetical protein